MRRRALGARVGGWISEEADLARSVAELDLTKPGWDDEVRLLGVVRRLKRDSTAEGVQAAIDVYGKDSVYEVMPCAGLQVVGDVVVDADGQRIYPSAPEYRRRIGVRSRNGESDLVPDANLSARERDLLLAFVKGHNPREIAVRMGLSVRTVSNLRVMVMRRLKAALSKHESLVDADERTSVKE